MNRLPVPNAVWVFYGFLAAAGLVLVLALVGWLTGGSEQASSSEIEARVEQQLDDAWGGDFRHFADCGDGAIDIEDGNRVTCDVDAYSTWDSSAVAQSTVVVTFLGDDGDFLWDEYVH